LLAEIDITVVQRGVARVTNHAIISVFVADHVNRARGAVPVAIGVAAAACFGFGYDDVNVGVRVNPEGPLFFADLVGYADVVADLGAEFAVADIIHGYDIAFYRDIAEAGDVPGAAQLELVRGVYRFHT